MLVDYLIIFLGLVFTILIEEIVAFIFNFKGSNEIKVIALASIVTYPVLTLILLVSQYISYSLVYGNYSIFYILFLEILVFIVEYLILKYVFSKKYKLTKLFYLALAMNAASYIFGELVFNPVIDLIF